MADAAKLAQFKAITAADDATAAQFLQQAGGNVEDAVNTFLTSGGSGGGGTASPAAPAAGGGGLGGMGSVRSVDPEDSKRQEYYAGGAASGAAILDPAKKEGDIFKRLQMAAEAQGQAGGEEEEEMGAQEDGGAPAAAGGGHNWGGGYSLGGEGKESQQVGTGGGGGGAAAGGAAGGAPAVLKRIIITRYSDGFTLTENEEEGEVRRPDQPENAMFLQDLERGQVPMELRPRVQNGNLDVALADKQDQPAPAPKFKAFSGGGGNTLGGGGDAEAAKAAIAAAASSGTASSWEGADESKPTTKLQIRLHDGQRLVASFNHTHTVGDIRAFINSSNPGMAAVTYSLATTFPRKVLADDSATIEGEGLLNGVVVQSLG